MTVPQPNFAEAHHHLALAFAAQDKADRAMSHFQRALALKPEDARIRVSLGNFLKHHGKFDDAMAQFRQALAIHPDYPEAHFDRAEIKTFSPGDADLEALEALAAKDDLAPNQPPYIHFALAKALEDCGDYARAFEHLRQGNARKRRQIAYNETPELEIFQRIAAVFDRSLFDRLRGEGNPSSVPVFVLGMPRSGSTMIEQILAGHPQIHAAGELPHFGLATNGVLSAADPPLQYPECVSTLDGFTLRRIARDYLSRLPALKDGKIHVTDKQPRNFLSVGLIHLILPHAKIIHTVRNPIDTCVSCYSKLFTSGQHFSYDLAELGRYYRRYRELMNHWESVLPPGAILNVSYEDVVDDIEGQARRLIDYCGLPWDDRCISFHTASRPVKTASAVQVRQPLFRRSLQRWRKYEAGVAPLLNELGDILTAEERSPRPLAARSATSSY